MTRIGKDWEKRLSGQPLQDNGFTPELKLKIRERVRMKKTKTKLAVRAALVLLCVLIAGSGWLYRDNLNEILFGKPSTTIAAVIEKDLLAEEGELTLRVQASQYSSFMNTFGKAFIIRHPSVRIELVNEPSQPQTLEEFQQWAEKEQPDIYTLPLHYYAELASEGKLQPLDAWIKSDGLDMDAFHEPVIDLLREAGGGQLYGLSPDFATFGVYINKALFEQHGIPLPTDGMTWEELLHTAARFDGTGVTGLRLHEPPIKLAQYIGQTNGVQAVSPDGDAVTMDTPAWEDIWSQVATGIQQGWIQSEASQSWTGERSMKQMMEGDPFAMGEAAMRLEASYYMNSLSHYTNIEGLELDWMVVTEPVNANEPNRATHYYGGTVYAVNAASPHHKAAWELVKFIHSEAMAEKLERTSNTLLVRKGALSSATAAELAPFYKLEPDPVAVLEEYRMRMGGTSRAAAQNNIFHQKGDALLQAVIREEMTVQAALQQLQTELEAVPAQGGEQQ